MTNHRPAYGEAPTIIQTLFQNPEVEWQLECLRNGAPLGEERNLGCQMECYSIQVLVLKGR